jgi:hypothetical protein
VIDAIGGKSHILASEAFRIGTNKTLTVVEEEDRARVRSYEAGV